MTGSGTVTFICDGHFRSGFGHAARCLQIAQYMRRKRPRLDVVFQGEYSEGARQRLQAGLPDIRFPPLAQPPIADVALIDRMSDFDDIEACDLTVVQQAQRCNAQVLYLASGVTAPELPEGIPVLGYQPGGPAPNPPTLYWGLDYAPVSGDVLQHKGLARDIGSALVAFGGAPDDRAPRLAARAVAAMPQIERVTVLGSPVNNDELSLPFRADQQVRYVRQVPEIGSLLARAGVVLASFGNLGYEALALGSPLCLLGTKRFQADFAASFARMDIAVSAGLLEECSMDRMTEALAETLARADALGSNASKVIDGRGIDRIAELLLERIGHA